MGGPQPPADGTGDLLARRSEATVPVPRPEAAGRCERSVTTSGRVAPTGPAPRETGLAAQTRASNPLPGYTNSRRPDPRRSALPAPRGLRKLGLGRRFGRRPGRVSRGRAGLGVE